MGLGTQAKGTQPAAQIDDGPVEGRRRHPARLERGRHSTLSADLSQDGLGLGRQLIGDTLQGERHVIVHAIQLGGRTAIRKRIHIQNHEQGLGLLSRPPRLISDDMARHQSDEGGPGAAGRVEVWAALEHRQQHVLPEILSIGGA